MENFIIYMGKACGLIAVFYLAYHALLKKETFFNSNRWFLLAGLFTAVALPLIVYTKTIWITPSPIVETTGNTIDLNQLMQYRQQFAQPQPAETISINWFDVIGGMYLAGVLLFFIRFVLDFLSIRRILKGNIVIKDGRFRLIDSEKARSPFSFFNYIVYNSAQLKQEELANIIVHEKVHSSQRHSLDMIISQLFCIAFWFNPFVWLYKKSISQNLEFIADAGAMKLMEDKQAYQKTLLKITVQPDCISLTNQFYQSLIKKRIVMLNKQQSKKMNSWKYAAVLPLLAVFMFLFQVKVVAQEKDAPKITADHVKATIEVNKDTRDSELEENKKTMKEEFDADIDFQNVTRNLNKEITGIKVTVKDKGQSQVYEVAGSTPITPFTIEVEKDRSGRNQIAFGTGIGDRNFVTARAFRIDNDDDGDMNDITNDTTRIKRHRIIRSYGMNDGVVPMAPPAPQFDRRIMKGSANKLRLQNSDQLIVIDGVKQKKTDAINLPQGLEINELNFLGAKEAKKKYGKDAKKGAVEITTRKANDMAFQMGPEVFSFDLAPQGNFDFEMPDFDILMEDFPNMPNMGRIFTDGDVQIIHDMSEEDVKRIQEELKKAHIELQDLGPRLDERLRAKEMSKDEVKAAKEEIEKAKKEIEESRKELEKSRKELEKARKELSKKA